MLCHENLELAMDFSTEVFLNCLHRFIAREELCRTIFSDNGTNFIDMRNELHKLGIFLKSKKYNTKMSGVLEKYRMWSEPFADITF